MKVYGYGTGDGKPRWTDGIGIGIGIFLDVVRQGKAWHGMAFMAFERNAWLSFIQSSCAVISGRLFRDLKRISKACTGVQYTTHTYMHDTCMQMQCSSSLCMRPTVLYTNHYKVLFSSHPNFFHPQSSHQTHACMEH